VPPLPVLELAVETMIRARVTCLAGRVAAPRGVRCAGSPAATELREKCQRIAPGASAIEVNEAAVRRNLRAWRFNAARAAPSYCQPAGDGASTIVETPGPLFDIGKGVPPQRDLSAPVARRGESTSTRSLAASRGARRERSLLQLVLHACEFRQSTTHAPHAHVIDPVQVEGPDCSDDFAVPTRLAGAIEEIADRVSTKSVKSGAATHAILTKMITSGPATHTSTDDDL